MRSPLTIILALTVTMITSANDPVPAPVVGVTEPGEQIDLSFPEAGVISLIDIEEGSAVKVGERLAQLDCRVLEAQLEIAQMRAESTAAVQSASATLDMRKERLAQLERLAANERANSDELSRARSENAIAHSDLQLAREATLEFALEAKQIQAQIEQRTLRAPFDGVVARIHRDPGASVSTQDGPVVSLVQLISLDLVVHIDQRRLEGLTVGQEIPVEALDRPVKAIGKVAFISPVVDPSSGTARLRLVLANEDGRHRSGVKYRIDLSEPVTQP